MNEHADVYLDWKDWKDESFGRFDAVEANYYAAETELVAGSGARVLELGFGNGPFIGWSKELGADVYGVELNPTLVDRCRAFLGEGHAFVDLKDRQLSALAGTFTHIVAFDVIEHIAQTELPAVFTRLAELLAPGGRIILRFPNGDSPFGRIYQHGDPTHLTTLGRFKILYLARESGLRALEIRAPRLSLKGVRLPNLVKRALVSAGRFCVERVVGYLYFGGRAIPLHPNYVAVLTHASAGDRRTQRSG
jgi:2-polyprenyl-3-methyl-5-hydroxy-6-metoxy-1,4-benzoquinol methylase